jgi:hypothetical protein
MRANTKKKHKMGKRFAILIGVAATGVMALGAQTASSTTGDPVDSTPPDLQLSGPKKQSPQNAKPIGASHCPRSLACYLEVRTSCGDEACTVRATGKLTNVKRRKLFPTGCLCPRAGGTFDLGPELAEEAQRREVRQALDEGKNVQAKVTVKAKDAAGNVATAKRTITLVKCGATSGPNCSAK